MNLTMRATLAAAFAALAVASTAAQNPDAIGSGSGRLTIRPIAHGTLALVGGGHVVLIDPARFVPGHPGPPKADLDAMTKAYLARHGGPPPPVPADREPDPELLVSAAPVRPGQLARFQDIGSPTAILVTHTHTDHLDPRAIAALRTPATRIIVPSVAAGMLLDVTGAQTMANGDRLDLGSGLVVEAVPMYNPAPDPTSGATFHPKGRGNGYVIHLGGQRIYVAGDSGCTPEMKALASIDVAFVPMNRPFTMTPDEAASCVRAMKPRVAYAYHHFESDPAAFAAALTGSGIEVRLRTWYPSALGVDR